MPQGDSPGKFPFCMGALVIRIGLWDPLYDNSNKEAPKQYR